MPDESSESDQHRQSERPSRRRVLSMTGTAVLGALAGCNGSESGGTPTEEATPTESPAPTPTDTETATPTATETPTPTATDRDVEALLAEYRCPGGDEYDAVVAQDGSGNFESVQAAIDAIPPGTSTATGC